VDAVPRQQRALQAELTRPPQVQPLGVATAPRELQETGARGPRDAQRVGQSISVEAVELAGRRRGPEGPLCAGVVEPADRLESYRGARGDLEAHRQCGEKGGAGHALPLAHRQHGRQYGAAGVRARQRLTLEGTDEDTVGEGRPRDVRAPVMQDDRGLGRPAELVHDGHDALRPGLHGADEAGPERVEHGDLAVIDEAKRTRLLRK